jgi:hypothetical protein
MNIIHYINLNDNHKKAIISIKDNTISNFHHDLILSDLSKENQSFIITDNDQLIAIVPLNFITTNDKKKVGTYYGLSIPGPLFIENLSLKKYKKILKLIFLKIDERCAHEKICEIKINFSDLVQFNTGSQKYFILLELLSLHGYVNKSLLGSRINLTETYDMISQNFTKGHKSEIKKSKNNSYSFENYQESKMGINEFYKILSDDKTNYIDDFIKPLYNLYKKNNIYIAFLATNKKFAAMFMLAGNTVEYFISSTMLNNQHSLIPEAIKFFKLIKKLQYLDLGIINSLENKELNQNEKKNNIALFKKGFGGEKYMISIFKKIFKIN